MKSTGKYYAVILVEFERKAVLVAPKTFIGLDFSMKELYVDTIITVLSFIDITVSLKRSLQRSSAG